MDEKIKVKGVFQNSHITISNDEISYNIPVEKQACHFGGFRYFFHCPVPKCNRRMRKLYFIQNCYFICRKCLNLGYYSQKVMPSRRFYLMRNKIQKHLENLGGSLYDKPKWMRWKTFKKLQNKESSYQIKSDIAIEEEIINMYGFPF